MTDATAFLDWLDAQPSASLPSNADTGQLDLRLCLRMFEQAERPRFVANDDYRHEFDSSLTCNYCGIPAERVRSNMSHPCPTRVEEATRSLLARLK